MSKNIAVIFAGIISLPSIDQICGINVRSGSEDVDHFVMIGISRDHGLAHIRESSDCDHV